MRQDHDYEDEDQSGRNPLRDHAKQLEAELEKERQRAAQGEAAVRKLAFIEAGIDVNTPTGKLFAKAYDGEFSPDAVKQAALEYGVIGEPAPVVASPDEQRAWSKASQSHASGAPAPASGDLLAAMRKANSPQERDAILAQALASMSG